jgi:hypothetical protein
MKDFMTPCARAGKAFKESVALPLFPSVNESYPDSAFCNPITGEDFLDR